MYIYFMGIFDRVGDVIKSYFADDEAGPYERGGGRRNSARDIPRDPDLDAAFEELDDFLTGGGAKTKASAGSGAENRAENSARNTANRGRGGRTVPEELRRDFAELGLEPGASAEECKNAYKRLLKLHHPDRHAGHEGNMKKATEKSARINAAYDRIDKWRKSL